MHRRSTLFIKGSNSQMMGPQRQAGSPQMVDQDLLEDLVPQPGPMQMVVPAGANQPPQASASPASEGDYDAVEQLANDEESSLL